MFILIGKEQKKVWCSNIFITALFITSNTKNKKKENQIFLLIPPRLKKKKNTWYNKWTVSLRLFLGLG